MANSAKREIVDQLSQLLLNDNAKMFML